MSITLVDITYPELVFGICGAVGVDINQVHNALTQALVEVGYTSVPIKLTDELYHSDNLPPPKANSKDYYALVNDKIDYANGHRERNNDPAFLARAGIRAIRRERAKLTGSPQKVPKTGIAYIVHQIKRPEEISLFRKVYAKKFILLSAYGSEESRKSLIEGKIRSSSHSHLEEHEAAFQAESLIRRDADEGIAYGQRLRDAFHTADFFVDGITKKNTEDHVERFVQAFFGRNDISPSKDEYGMYAAKSASLRSADLSRQVGAAIFSDDGELITQGCNEVPKAFGGTYWDSEEPDYRDIRVGNDPNDNLRKEILKDLFERLKSEDMLSKKAKALGSPLQIAEALTKKSRNVDGTETPAGPLHDSMIMDLTEYGRIVHAEMCAICDAARLGRSVKGATLYCTTFPCHNCTKHVLASGIKRVVYMEPYPKSKAKDLHGKEIQIEEPSVDKVSFVPFLGISPARYRDIFQKGRRKGSDGKATDWQQGSPRPTIEIVAALYTEIEVMAVASLVIKETIPLETSPSGT